MSQPLSYSGRRTPDQPTPPSTRRRASDSDTWLVYAALLPYAVPIETVVRRRPERPLPFGMLKRVSRAERIDARRQTRERNA